MSIRTAISETLYAAERKRFDTLLREKARLLARLDSEEYFHSADYDLERTQWQIARLEREIQDMTGYMMAADGMGAAHEEEVYRVAEGYERREEDIVRFFRAELRKKEEELIMEREQHAATARTAETFITLFYKKMNYKDEQNSSDGPQGGL